MTLKIGCIVNHSGALGWGAGKVLEVTATSAMIQFSDGQKRRIAASHYLTLQPAAPHTFTPPPELTLEKKVLRVPRVAKKKK